MSWLLQRRLTALRGVLVALMLTVGASGAVGDDLVYNFEVSGGEKAAGVEGWQRLLAFQTRLRELLGVPEGADLQLADVGCALCGDFEPVRAQKNGQNVLVPPVNPPATVTYVFFGKDRDRIAPIFAEAYNAVQSDKDLQSTSFRMTVSGLQTSRPLCSDYQQPCVKRAVCTMYGGCSRSSTSCVQCIMP
ncbi:MAG: hypothetical protein JNJ67_06070 [Chromatiales bacterium]|nr:hypothetical protein [Chromatiales bacterium]